MPFVLSRGETRPTVISLSAKDAFADIEYFAETYLKDRFRVYNTATDDTVKLTISPSNLAAILHAIDALLPPEKVADWTFTLDNDVCIIRTDSEVFRDIPSQKFHRIRGLALASGLHFILEKNETTGSVILAIPTGKMPTSFFARGRRVILEALLQEFDISPK